RIARGGRERGPHGDRGPLCELRLAPGPVRFDRGRARGVAPQHRRYPRLRFLRQRRDLRRPGPRPERRPEPVRAVTQARRCAMAWRRRLTRETSTAHAMAYWSAATDPPMNSAFVPFERKIIDPLHIGALLADLPRPLVFTNGVFDIL